MADDGLKLDYEEMLSALQALLRHEVVVVIELRYDRQLRPLAMLKGVLSSGQVGDLSDHEGARLGYPAGEAVGFFVGTDHCWFVVRRGDFKRGRRKDEVLSFETGRTRTFVSASTDLPS